jgi:hypothetical protein
LGERGNKFMIPYGIRLHETEYSRVQDSSAASPGNSPATWDIPVVAFP